MSDFRGGARLHSRRSPRSTSESSRAGIPAVNLRSSLDECEHDDPKFLAILPVDSRKRQGAQHVLRKFA